MFSPGRRWQLVLRAGGAGLLLLGSSLEQSLAAQREAITLGVSQCRPVVVPSAECFRQAAASPQWIPNLSARAPDHRYEGLAIGAVLGAIGGGLLGAVACEQSEDPNFSCTKAVLGIGLFVGGLGGLTGLLVGAQFPKGSQAAPADSTAQ